MYCFDPCRVSRIRHGQWNPQNRQKPWETGIQNYVLLMDIQLSNLVIEPLQKLQSIGFDFEGCPFLIIIDGLDECQGVKAQSDMVRSLAISFHQSPLRIRILIASRPELHLQSTFGSSAIHPHLSRLGLSNEYSPDEDIYLFLEDSFDEIKREHPLASHIPSTWPSSDVLHELTEKSSGQFNFASTTINYVGRDPQELPTRRLDVVRQLQPARSEEELPFAELHSLYYHILSNVRNVKKVRQILEYCEQECKRGCCNIDATNGLFSLLGIWRNTGLPKSAGIRH